MAAGPFEPPGPRACVSTGQAGWLTTSTLGQAVQPRQQAASAGLHTVWLVDSSGWLQLSQRTVVTAAHRSGADASQLTVACLRPALIALVVGLARLGDGPACCRANLVESMCARLSVSSTECVMIVVEVGAHAPTSHPSPSPLGIKPNLLIER